MEAGAKVRIITGRASGKEVFFRGFPKKKGKGLVFRTVTEEGRAGGSECEEGRDTIYILRAGARVHYIIGAGKRGNRMRATGKEDAGRLKTGGGQRGERIRAKGKRLAKGWEKGRGKGRKVTRKEGVKMQSIQTPLLRGGGVARSDGVVGIYKGGELSYTSHFDTSSRNSFSSS